MLQTSFIRDNTSLVLDGLRKRGFPDAEKIIEAIVQLDGHRREAQSALDNILAFSNTRAKEIGVLLKSGKKDEAEAAKADTARLKEQARQCEDELRNYESTLYEAILKLPNIPHRSVPEGRTAEDNEVVLEQGEKPGFPNPLGRAHWELIKQLGIIDFELGSKITGAGFPVYKNKGARLQRALIAFFLDEAVKAGYQEMQVPILVNEDSAFATGQLPDKEGQMYYAEADNLYVIPTAEVPLTNIYRNEILAESYLPVKLTGYTPCFRREAGSWGAHVRGLNRLHQFDKVEIVQITKPGDSYAAFEEMVTHVQSLFQKLELPFRILRLCGGDMGFTSALTYDFEVWSAGQGRWLECSSVSNFESFQANRLKLRFKSEGNKPQLLHTLNGSALALPRIMAALLENNQQADGSVKIPAALVNYSGFDKIS